MKGKITKKITIFILHIYLEKKPGINFDTSGIKAIKKSDIPMHEIMRNIDCFYYHIMTLYTFYRTRMYVSYNY